MAAVLLYTGMLRELSLLLTALGSNLKIGLFTAPAVVVPGNIYTDFTLATFPGYAPAVSTFGSLAIDGNNNASTTGSAVTFTSSGSSPSNTIYGYIVYDGSVPVALYAEAFSAPILINAAGQSITITPTMYLGKLAPPY